MWCDLQKGISRLTNLACVLIVVVQGVTMEEFVDGDVRLVNGQNPAEGRVEVYYQGEWGTVCDDGWDMSEANVVCRQLGFSSANTTHCCAFFGHGEGQIMLDDLGCRGDESDLGSCNHRGWSTHNCAHTEDASVTCNGKIRLVDGADPFEGRVELYQNNGWGTICNLGWDMKDATVVCRLMGYPSANSTTAPPVFGEGNGSVVVKDVACLGTEDDITDCPQTFNDTCNGMGTDPDVGAAGVRCTRPIRLVGGSSEMEGHVEIYDNGRYGPICDVDWDLNDARVVCNQLGNLAPLQAVTGSRYGEYASLPKISGVNCGGSETTLEQCGHSGWDIIPDTCTGATLAGVVCTPAVRLVGGSNQLEGRAEVYVNNQWGSICADNWDSKDAKVFCNQLGGYPVNLETCCYSYQQASLSVFMADVQCSGNETYMMDCVHSTDHSCSQQSVVGVRCQSTVRLTGGNNPLMGNVEVLHNGEWGSVCDDNWDINDARVVCRQLGNYEAVTSSCCSHYSSAQGDIILDDVGCSGSESTIEDCYHSSWGSHNCGPSEAAGVSCRKIRLVADDSTTLPKGRVEMVYNGQWGRICSDGWGQEESDVLCRQLYNSTSEPHQGDFGRGVGPIFLTQIQCIGDETDLFSCPNTIHGDYQCNGPDAFVVCRGGLRLADGRTALEGRVEIFQDGQWGTICDDNWDINDAKVVCRQLGNYEVLTSKCCAAYGHGSGPILLDGVGCIGTEEILEDCPHEGWGTHNCQHYEDASVACTDLRLTYGNGTVATNKLKGRVEVWKDTQWKAICYDNFDIDDAAVICRQLFNTDALSFDRIDPSPDVDIGVTNLGCTGNETLLITCPYLTYIEQPTGCASGAAASIVCKDIRLTGGSVPSEGAVEILENGEWGFICGDTWGDAEGKVACRQLGFCPPKKVKRGWDNKPQNSRREMHWYGMNCTGDESRLRECQYSAGAYPCNGFNFEGAVICASGCDAPPKLRHGNYSVVQDVYTPGEQIVFKCDKGYELIGEKSNTCGSDCQWRSAFPECQRNIIPSSKPTDGKVDGGTDGKKKDKSTSPGGRGAGGGAGGVLFVVGMIIGIIVVITVGLIIWLLRVRRRNTYPGTSSIFSRRHLTGNNIFKPKRQDDMEEPVLSFNASQAGGEDGSL
ncbi:scavenger receptor cysteine-rich domain superfamily protein-like isoform X1 [Apostichopus japonicus]|uniref:scavenger receptor cysteine-rich domain superfamily protein-like isoform X1 n=1 Tax=Stichopus japonicus TaxID=307972 RepID=UPI003AB4FD92